MGCNQVPLDGGIFMVVVMDDVRFVDLVVAIIVEISLFVSCNSVVVDADSSCVSVNRFDK